MIFAKYTLKTLLRGWVLLGLMGLIQPGGARAEVDNRLYADLLGRYVHHGVVDYAGLKKAEARLDGYLKVLEVVDASRLDRNQQLAFYINAYNAWTLKLILSAYPQVASIKDLGTVFQSPWKKKIARIDGALLTLDHIEHDIIRPRFADARVHFAVNCASRGCPPLISEPFRADRLQEQLDAATRAFINDRERNYLQGNTLHVSKIFKWFAKDFTPDRVSFFIAHAEQPLKAVLESRRDQLKIKYLDYDWALNGQ